MSKTTPPLSIIEIILAKRTADHISIKKLMNTTLHDSLNPLTPEGIQLASNFSLQYHKNIANDHQP